MLKHAQIELWRRIDVTMTLHCDFVTNSVTSQSRRSNVGPVSRWPSVISYLCHVTLWPVCESHCDQIANHTVAKLWIRWRLWCETGSLLSPKSQPLKQQAWKSRAWVRTLSGHGLTGPRLKIFLFTRSGPALHFIFVGRGPGFTLIWLLGQGLDNFVRNMNRFRIRLFCLFV